MFKKKVDDKVVSTDTAKAHLEPAVQRLLKSKSKKKWHKLLVIMNDRLNETLSKGDGFIGKDTRYLLDVAVIQLMAVKDNASDHRRSWWWSMAFFIGGIGVSVMMAAYEPVFFKKLTDFYLTIGK